jgi:hypothetical protein
MKKIALAVLLASAFTASQAAVITFDDLSGGESPIANGYAGLNWNNFWSLDGVHYGSSGYQNGVVSANRVAFNAYGDPASLSGNGFSLYSGEFTAAWNDGLQIRADAVFEGGATSSVTFTANTSGPINEVFGWNNLSSVTFTSFGGTAGPWGFNGEHFALDNLSTAAAVPESSNLALMVAGLGLVGVAARRRKV